MPLNSCIILAQISREVLLLGLALPVAAAVGFAFGILYERWYQAAALQRLGKRFEKLFEHTAGLLDRAEKACAMLSARTGDHPLLPRQSHRLLVLSQKLAGQLTNLVSRSESSADAAQPETNAIADRNVRSRPLQWIRGNVDAQTGLPDAVAYEQNLRLLVRAGEQAREAHGVLFVQLDQHARLAERLGRVAAAEFLRQISSLVLRQLRETDLLCQVERDLLVAFLPEITRSSLEERAQAARLAIRRHEFVNPETGRSVFVTASFGFTLLGRDIQNAADPLAELRKQAEQALQASRKHGRCQLHEITAAGSSRLVSG
ncbi:MAG: diguanylate cyclase [Planctomycetaceae bacterium]|nr:GGDEF domain-containing protein [Planctomycetaceae bacterium]